MRDQFIIIFSFRNYTIYTDDTWKWEHLFKKEKNK